MSAEFFEHPILNTPYERPIRHWELKDGQPTGRVIEKRRPADFITPIPKSRKQKQAAGQGQLGLVQDATGGIAGHGGDGAGFCLRKMTMGLSTICGEWRLQTTFRTSVWNTVAANETA